MNKETTNLASTRTGATIQELRQNFGILAS